MLVELKLDYPKADQAVKLYSMLHHSIYNINARPIAKPRPSALDFSNVPGAALDVTWAAELEVLEGGVKVFVVGVYPETVESDPVTPSVTVDEMAAGTDVICEVTAVSVVKETTLVKVVALLVVLVLVVVGVDVEVLVLVVVGAVVVLVVLGEFCCCD